MQIISRSIIATVIALGGMSMVYFFSLVCGIPFVLTVTAAIAIAAVATWYFTINGRDDVAENDYIPRLPLYILLTGVIIIVVKSQALALKYGGWDAWTIWNFHAKFLASGDNWKNLFSGTIDHPDYPLLVPGVNGFFLRLFAGYGATLIPFVFSFVVAIFIPVLIYVETRSRSIIASAIIYLVLANDAFFLQNSLTQYADAPLAFFFLGALVSVGYSDADPRYVVASAACLGCCIWTKNEGVILSVIFLLFHLKHFFSRRVIWYSLAGMAIPLLAFFVFKHFYAPSNDIVGGQNAGTFKQLFIWNRYKVIWTHFVQELDEHFYYAKVGFALYVLICIIEKKWPDKNFIMLTLCLLAYLMIYVLTPASLEWHLNTSLSRLMLQLMPAMMFVFAQKFSGGKISFVTKKPF